MSAQPRLQEPAPSATPVEVTPCAHCGQPIPEHEGDGSQGDPAFCCAGCRAVYDIVHAAGLASYYEQTERTATRPVSGKHRAYEELDDATFQQLYCRRAPDGTCSSELLLEGVHCSACVWLVERVGRVVPGVLRAELDLSRNVLALEWDPARTALSAIARGLTSLGYAAHPVGAGSGASLQTQQRALLLRLGVAGAAAGNVMLLSLALYSGAFSGMELAYQTLFRWTSLAIATPAVFWAGSVFLRGGLAALRTRTPHMDLPVSIGILAGYAGGAVSTLRGSGEVYFDSLCALIFLLLIGRHLQQNHHRRSSTRSELLLALAPQAAHLVDGDRERDVPAANVTPGALVRVGTGERVPVDGLVERGRACLDTSLLTGEPMPSEVRVTDRVYAGTQCDSGEVWLRVEAAGDTTRLGRLMASVEATQRERAPIVRLADRVSGYFVLGVLAAAAATWLLWQSLDATHALDHTIALLVVTCPCALGMATPLAVSAALGRAARAGVLFKGGEFVEELARPATIVFDKTGTLTLGQPELLAWLGDAELQAPLRALEARSTHPIARAVVRALPQSALQVASVEELPLGGIRGRVGDRELLVGSPKLMQSEQAAVPEWAQRLATRHAEAGHTPVLIAADGVVRAVAAFGDELRPEAQSQLEELARLGFRFEILSGDHPSVVRDVATRLGIPQHRARGAQSPEAKREHIGRLRRHSRVIMVGDGVNDAAAMAAANVGIAVHGGAETCLRAADVFTTRAGLAPLVAAARGARRTLRVIRRGIAVSLAYNGVGIALAVTGHLNPLLAAVLMPLSSISVISLALKARTF